MQRLGWCGVRSVEPGPGGTRQYVNRRAFHCNGGMPACRYAIGLHDVPEKITIDKSRADTAAVHGLIEDSGAAIELRPNNYSNNIVEQDHRATNRRVRPMLGFKSFGSAAKLIAASKPCT